MKIVVPVKQVAVLDEEFELLEDRPGVDPDAIDWELNEWDDFSVEAAALGFPDGTDASLARIWQLAPGPADAPDVLYAGV